MARSSSYARDTLRVSYPLLFLAAMQVLMWTYPDCNALATTVAGATQPVDVPALLTAATHNLKNADLGVTPSSLLHSAFAQEQQQQQQEEAKEAMAQQVTHERAVLSNSASSALPSVSMAAMIVVALLLCYAFGFASAFDVSSTDSTPGLTLFFQMFSFGGAAALVGLVLRKLTAYGGASGAQKTSFGFATLGGKGPVGEKVYEQTITDYNELFSANATTDLRKSKYATVVNHYYDLVTDFYEWGWGSSFHFAVQHSGETFHSAMARHEHLLALASGWRPGQRIVDVGCGIGGPLRELARFAKVHITGINNNAYQCERARVLCQRAGLEAQSAFVKCDFMKIPLPEASYDHAFQIEATCHAPDRVGVFKEIHRLVKPGGMFAGYEWCMTDNYDSKNAEHNEIKHLIQEGDALPDIVHTSVVRQALIDAGFELIIFEDLAPVTPQNNVPWYHHLAGSYLDPKRLHLTWFGTHFNKVVLRALELVRVVPAGTSEVQAMLMKGREGLLRGGEQELFSPMVFFVAKKPAAL